MNFINHHLTPHLIREKIKFEILWMNDRFQIKSKVNSSFKIGNKNERMYP